MIVVWNRYQIRLIEMGELAPLVEERSKAPRLNRKDESAKNSTSCCLQSIGPRLVLTGASMTSSGSFSAWTNSVGVESSLPARSARGCFASHAERLV